jgi:hypothetical protein
LVAVLVALAAVSCSPAARGDGQSPVPAKDHAPASVPAAAAGSLDLKSDVVSGCVTGAPLVKVLINLRPTDKRGCRAEVTPASVCVAPGGVVRFKIDNECDGLEGEKDTPALEIAQPKFKMALGSKQKPPGGLPPVLANCGLKFARVDRRSPGHDSVLLCDVPNDAFEGFYKYGLSGKIEPLDPDVEVRPSR